MVGSGRHDNNSNARRERNFTAMSGVFNHDVGTPSTNDETAATTSDDTNATRKSPRRSTAIDISNHPMEPPMPKEAKYPKGTSILKVS